MTDLLTRLRAGDARARLELFRSCQTRLRPYFRSRLPDLDDLEDCVSEVVTRALEGIAKGASPDVLDAWIIGIAGNLIKERYREAARRADGNLPVDVQREPIDPPLELDRMSSDNLPELPEELEFLLGKVELWMTLRSAIDGIATGLQHVMREHLRLSVERNRLVVGRELAAALDLPSDRLDRQLNRARDATRDAIVALVVARTGGSGCTQLSQIVRENLRVDQLPTDRAIVLDPKQSKAILAHATGCQACRPRVRDAGEYSRWATGPALVGLADDDDERRRAVAAVFGHAADSPTAPAPGAAVAAVPTSIAVAGHEVSTSGGPLRLADRLRAALISRMARPPESDPLAQLAQNPDMLRRVATVAVGGVALVVAAVVLLTAAAPDQARPESMPPSTAAAPPPGMPSLPSTTTSDVPSSTLTPPPATTIGTTPIRAIEPSHNGSDTSTTPQTTTTDPLCTFAWRTVAVPEPDPQHNALLDLAARTDDDIWAAGWTSTGVPDSASARATLIEHWDGTSWTVTSTPSPGSWSQLQAITAPSREVAWAVGVTVPATGTTQALILRWNGSAWSQESSPTIPGSTTSVLTGIWAPNATEAWAVGWASIGGSIQALILHWTAGEWHTARAALTTGPTVLTAVGGSGPDDAWAIGTVAGKPLTQHWDGSLWRDQSNPGLPANTGLNHVRARSPNDAWAAGSFVDPADHRTKPLALRWDGKQWSQMPGPNLGSMNSTFTDVVDQSNNDLRFVGTRDYTGRGDAGTGKPLIMQWNGAQWADLPPPGSPPGGTLTSAAATGNGNLWALGYTNNADGTTHIAVHHYLCT